MRALGIDLGSRRIGVAVSDPQGMVASALEVVARSGSVERDHRALMALAEECDAEVVVVGVPLSLDGTVGPAAAGVLDEIEQFRQHCRLPVETVDERLTTVEAHRLLRASGLNAKRARGVVDKVAAAVLLQAWLDSRALTGPDGGRHDSEQ